MELTPQKYKLLQLIGCVIVLLSVAAWYFLRMRISELPQSVAPMNLAATTACFGLVVYCVGRFLAWWHHG